MTKQSSNPIAHIILPEDEPIDPPSGVRHIGEGEAFDVVFTSFASEQHRGLAKWARANDIPPAIAEEMLQQALLVLWQKRDGVERSRWGGWVGEAMHRLGQQYFRSRRCSKRLGPEVAWRLHDWQEDVCPETAAHERQCERELRRLLDDLERAC